MTLNHYPLLAQQRFVKKDPNEGPVCFQLSSNSVKELGEAVKRVTDFGADLIDLNCGCPVKKIRSKGAGSGLLSHPRKLFDFINAMKANTHVPVSIKIRVQGQGIEDEKFNAELAQVVSDAGADFITVHGRHWTEHYETPCRHDEIQFFVENLKIPVIGNGDVFDLASLKRMLDTGCAGVMIGRAGMGQPWLIKRLLSEMQGETFVVPNRMAIGEMFMRHVRELAELLHGDKFAILQARKFAKYYAREMPDRDIFCEKVNQCETREHFELICKAYFS